MDARRVLFAGPGVVAPRVANAPFATRLRTQRSGLRYSRSRECKSTYRSIPTISRTRTF